VPTDPKQLEHAVDRRRELLVRMRKLHEAMRLMLDNPEPAELLRAAERTDSTLESFREATRTLNETLSKTPDMDAALRRTLEEQERAWVEILEKHRGITEALGRKLETMRSAARKKQMEKKIQSAYRNP
jgi:hypothetical protein